MRPFRLTLVHPAMGRRPGQRFLRSWQMEPLPDAVIAGLTPKDVEVRFFDDRMERVPFDAPADLVAMSVETYTARRAYEIASEYRRRGVPVVMGGFHATLCPDEVERFAEAVVVGEAERLWPEVLDDFRSGRPKRRYREAGRTSLAAARPDRAIFRGKRYLPLGLVESGRGCRFRCEFCAIQAAYHQSRTSRPIGDFVEDLGALRDRKLIFLVDDNFGSDLDEARELARAMGSAGVRWVSQCSIQAAHDEELVALLARSGCQGLLIGFEALDARALHAMAKGFNAQQGGFEPALRNLRRHGLRVYGTFLFGYDEDGPASFGRAVEFAVRHDMFLAAFAHLMPLPGTPLYARLEREGRLTRPRWWLDPSYAFNEIAFAPRGMTAEELRAGCLEARRDFYRWRSIARRALARVNRADAFMWRAFLLLNAMHRRDVERRDGYPLGDPAFRGELLEAA